MPNILNLTFPELVAFMENLGQVRFRAVQVWQWLWQKMARSFDDMTDVAKATRALLAEAAIIQWPEIVATETSRDRTVKFLLQLADGARVETVLIPSEARSGAVRMTQCLSCQVGCALGCTFCATGSMGFTRNMTHGEILGQVLVAREYLGDTRPDHPILRNLVFMGMGEPLCNFDQVVHSLRSLHHDKGLNFSPRRVTVSTCGMKHGLRELGETGLAYLAVSLHAPTQDLRAQLMPKAAQWHLHELMATLASYPLKTRERITFEYLLLGGVNDSVEHAQALAQLIASLKNMGKNMGKNTGKAKINLIIYNPIEGIPYVAPSLERVLAFEQCLWDRHITAIVRKSKGQDIHAACGQLSVHKS